MKLDFTIKSIDKSQAKLILDDFHYLSQISRGFKSGYNYGLFHKEYNLVGVIIFTGLPVPELAMGMFGLGRTEQQGLFELSRLCVCTLWYNIRSITLQVFSWGKHLNYLEKKLRYVLFCLMRMLIIT